MADTLQDQKNKAGTASKEQKIQELLTQLVKPSTENSNDFESGIDPAKYEQADIGSVTAAKALTTQFSDPELLEIISKNSANKEEGLLAVLVAEAHLRTYENPALRTKVKELAIAGDYKRIMEEVAIDVNGRITEEHIEKAILGSLPSLLTKKTDERLFNDYKFEMLQGQLGSGIKVTFQDSQFEHYDITDKMKLRISKVDNKYRAVMHFTSLDGKKNDFMNYKQLLDTVNLVFSPVEEGKKASVKDLVNNASPKELYNKILDYLSTDKKQKTKEKTLLLEEFLTLAKKKEKNKHHNVSLDSNGVMVHYNQKDQFRGLNKYLDVSKVGLGADVLLMTSYSTNIAAGLLTYSSTHHLNPAFYFNVVAGGLYALAAALNGGLVFYRPKKRDKEHLENYLNSKKSISNLMADRTSFEEASMNNKPVKELDHLREDYLERIEELKGTFEKMAYVKGYSIEFQSENIEDIYLKAAQVAAVVKESQKPEIAVQTVEVGPAVPSKGMKIIGKVLAHFENYQRISSKWGGPI